MTVPELKLDYAPHPAQRQVHEDPTRHRVLAWGRRSGKSWAALWECLRTMLERPGAQVCFASPVFAQARSRFRSFVEIIEVVDVWIWILNDAINVVPDGFNGFVYVV